MKVAHSFQARNKKKPTPAILLGKYQKASIQLLEELREKGYKILTDVEGYSSRGIPNSFVVISEKEISACDVKDDFLLVARDIRIENNLAVARWDFEPGQIYQVGV